jgi:DNA-directed RNA polymerase subunit RPC12/RpoP
MFNICRRCGKYHADKEIDPSGPYAVCPECGERHLFRQLPLLLICGPSGGGKSAVLRTLLGRVEDAVLLEGDLLWRPEFNRPDDNYRDFFETWLRLAKNISQSGRPVALFNAGAIPPNVELCVERRYFSKTHYLALVCDATVLEARLKARPAWRSSGDREFIAAQIEFNQWLKANAAKTEPAIDLLDSTTVGEMATAARAARWLREHAGV